MWGASEKAQVSAADPISWRAFWLDIHAGPNLRFQLDPFGHLRLVAQSRYVNSL